MSKVNFDIEDGVHIQLSWLKKGLLAQLDELSKHSCAFCECFPTKFWIVKGKSRDYMSCANCLSNKKVVVAGENKSDAIINAAVNRALPILQEGENRVKVWRETYLSTSANKEIREAELEKAKRLSEIAADLEF